MWFFTGDEHYFHRNVIRFCDRPFENLDEMHYEIKTRHNEIVSKRDITVHLGDFSFGKREKTRQIIKELNGEHIFIQGDHDKWAQNQLSQIWSKKIDNHFIVCCHYPLFIWPRSHYGSWHLFGHCHEKLNTFKGKTYNVGIDNNNYYPFSLEQIENIMSELPENPNLVKNVFN